MAKYKIQENAPNARGSKMLVIPDFDSFFNTSI